MLVHTRIRAALLSLGFATLLGCAARGEDTSSPPTVYEGTVGSAQIVMQLEGPRGDVSGQYFYRSSRFDINLAGEFKSGVLRLKSALTGDNLTLKGEKLDYKGTLTTAKGKTFPVRLHEVGPAALPNLPPGAPADLTTYEKLQISGLTLKTQKAETIEGREIRWRIEPVSGARMFRIEGGYSTAAMEALNLALTQILWRNASAYFACPGSDGGAGMESMETAAPWLSDAYVSVAVSKSWSCAHAAHPDFGAEAHSFDAKTGKEIDLDDVISFGADPVPAKDTNPWYDYRKTAFGPGLVILLERFHPKEMKRTGQDGCDYSESEAWDFPTWRLTPKGLYVGALFPRVMRSCDNPEWSIIPWAAVEEARKRRP